MNEFIKTTTDKLGQLASLDDLTALKNSMNTLEAKFSDQKDETINHLTDSEVGKKAIEKLVSENDLVTDKINAVIQETNTIINNKADEFNKLIT